MTIKEIAQLAGVSVSTVSKVMNNKDSSISAETRERVLQTAKQFNYVPYAGSATGDTKSFLLGVIFSSSNALKMIDGILDAAQAQDIRSSPSKHMGIRQKKRMPLQLSAKIISMPYCGRRRNLSAPNSRKNFVAIISPACFFHLPVISSRQTMLISAASDIRLRKALFGLVTKRLLFFLPPLSTVILSLKDIKKRSLMPICHFKNPSCSIRLTNCC